MGRPTTSSVYAVVLQKDQPSPVAPESDEEPDAGAAPAAGGKHDKPAAAGKEADKKGDKAEKSAKEGDEDRPRRHRPAHRLAPESTG